MINWKFWKRDDGLFPSAEESTLSTIKAKKLNEDNEIIKLKDQLKKEIVRRCSTGYDSTSFYYNGQDDLAYLYKKYETKIKSFLVDSGYSVEKDSNGFVNIKWDDKQTLFNKQMKDIISK
jgi:hypothetical protein